MGGVGPYAGEKNGRRPCAPVPPFFCAFPGGMPHTALRSMPPSAARPTPGTRSWDLTLYGEPVTLIDRGRQLRLLSKRLLHPRAPGGTGMMPVRVVGAADRAKPLNLQFTPVGPFDPSSSPAQMVPVVRAGVERLLRDDPVALAAARRAFSTLRADDTSAERRAALGAKKTGRSRGRTTASADPDPLLLLATAASTRGRRRRAASRRAHSARRRSRSRRASRGHP